MANVVLIFKKGKKDDPRNYKPVILTSVPGKIMENIILGDVEKHFRGNTVVSQNKHGLVKGQRCLANLISL